MMQMLLMSAKDATPEQLRIFLEYSIVNKTMQAPHPLASIAVTAVQLYCGAASVSAE
jgi:hypothetical protein